MDSNHSCETEVSRIRAAYQRRDYTVPRDRYSVFKDENLISRQQLEKHIIKLLKQNSHAQLEQKKIIEVGCGAGFWLRQFVQWGARPENLFGIDLIPEKIDEGKRLCPQGMTLQCGDASKIPFQDRTFDLVLQFTVFTSILDLATKKNVAVEMSRLLKPGGAILWYDYFVSNPANPDVRGVTQKQISQLFPGFSIFLERITLAPPLGRAIAPISPLMYRLLSSFKLLCTHYLGLLNKQ